MQQTHLCYEITCSFCVVAATDVSSASSTVQHVSMCWLPPLVPLCTLPCTHVHQGSTEQTCIVTLLFHATCLLQGMVENRRCRDVLFLLLFVAYWVGMFIVCGIAFQSGEKPLLACIACVRHSSCMQRDEIRYQLYNAAAALECPLA